MKRKIYTILRIAISLTAIGTLLWLIRGKIGDIFATLAQTKIWIFGAAFLVTLSTVAILSLRLKKVLQAQGIHLSLKELIHLTFIGYFFNNFLPTSLGGDVVKAYYASRRTKRTLESFTSVFVDRAVGLFSLVLIASIALCFLGGSVENVAVKWAILVMLIGTILFTLLLLNKAIVKKLGFLLTISRFFKIDSKMKRLYNAINSYRNHKRIVWQVFYLSLASQGIAIFANYLMARSLLVTIPLKTFFLLMPIVFAVSMLPSLGGLGIREGAYVYFFRGVLQPEDAFALSLLYLASLLGISLIGGVIYMLKGEWTQTFQMANAEERSDPIRRGKA